MKHVKPEIQELVDRMIALSRLSHEEQDAHPDSTYLFDEFSRMAQKGSDIMRSFSTDPDAKSVMIKDNPMFCIVIGAMHQAYEPILTQLIDPQDSYTLVCVVIGALIENGTLVVKDE